ncbi:MAG: membrane protein insertion efficiency factor YidD [Clostridia bacterium]|nr:membrane protein insertion efficiency factor YidD [Clostridia bacterium]
MLKRILCAPVRLYRRFISPYTPRACRFTPSCSEYFILAVEEWGILGLFMSAWRVLRCNPWSRGGYDPPPKNPRKKK